MFNSKQTGLSDIMITAFRDSDQSDVTVLGGWVWHGLGTHLHTMIFLAIGEAAMPKLTSRECAPSGPIEFETVPLRIGFGDF